MITSCRNPCPTGAQQLCGRGSQALVAGAAGDCVGGWQLPQTVPASSRWEDSGQSGQQPRRAGRGRGTHLRARPRRHREMEEEAPSGENKGKSGKGTGVGTQIGTPWLRGDLCKDDCLWKTPQDPSHTLQELQPMSNPCWYRDTPEEGHQGMPAAHPKPLTVERTENKQVL